MVDFVISFDFPGASRSAGRSWFKELKNWVRRLTIPATYIGLEDSCHSIFCDTLVDNSPLNENSFAQAFGGAGGNAPRTPLVGENIMAWGCRHLCWFSRYLWLAGSVRGFFTNKVVGYEVPMERLRYRWNNWVAHSELCADTQSRTFGTILWHDSRCHSFGWMSSYS